MKARDAANRQIGACSAEAAPGGIDPFDPLLHFVDGRNRPGEPFGPVIPRVKLQRPPAAGRGLPPRGPRIPKYFPNERRMALKPFPVEDWVRGEFSASAETCARPSTPARAGSRRTASPKVGGRALRPRNEVIHVRFQESASWFTPSGVAKKRRMLEAKGMPDMKGRRFITLSMDRQMFGDCPLTAYLAGKDHVRRFLEAGRLASLWKRGAWWAWKLEFQKDGWPHWHLIIDRTAKFSRRDFDTIKKIWGMGRTNCRRISKSKFGYQFKYAFKGVFQDDSDGSGLCVPKWFLDYYKPGTDEAKPESFGRCRFWQTSKGFYTGKRVPAPEAKEPETSIVPLPAREILEGRQRSLLVVSRDSAGKYQSSQRLRLGVDYQRFIRVHLWDAENGAGCTLSARSFALDPQTLKTKLIEKTDSWKLQQLLRDNRLTLKKALWFRAERRSLETC